MRILNEGTRLAGRYSLIRRLGAGGMSETWLADDDHADARVVLKFLTAAAAGDLRQKELSQLGSKGPGGDERTAGLIVGADPVWLFAAYGNVMDEYSEQAEDEMRRAFARTWLEFEAACGS